VQTPTASVVMMVVTTIRNGGDVVAASDRGGDVGDHNQQ
jgi:hypothetical protein